MVRLVLFDIDGTLLLTGGAGRKAFGHAFRSAFQLAKGTDGVDFAGRTDTSLVRQILLKHELEANGENFKRFFDSYVFWLEYVLSHNEGCTCPYVHEFVASLQSLPDPPTLGLLTGNVRLGAEIKLRHYNLWDHFVTGGFGDDSEDRNLIAKVAHQRASTLLGRELAGDEVLVIGDTPLDVACAKAISARCLAVATGTTSLEELTAHGPTWAVPTLAHCRLDELLS